MYSNVRARTCTHILVCPPTLFDSFNSNEFVRIYFNYEFVFEYTIHFIGMHLQILFMHKIFWGKYRNKISTAQNVQPKIAYADGNFG